MSRRSYGFRDERTGNVVRAYDKDDALRVADNSITGRYVAVVLVEGEWLELVRGAPARPPRPRASGVDRAGVGRASLWPIRRLWGYLRPVKSGGVEFRRHNGHR